MLKMTKTGRMERGQLPATTLLMAAIVATAPCAFADEAAAAAAGVDLDFAYCESTGEQYIDTGILGNPGLKVEAEIMWTEPNLVTTADQHILGSFDKVNNGNTSWRCYLVSMSANRYPFFYYGEQINNLAWQYSIGQRYRVTLNMGESSQSFIADGMDGTAPYSYSVGCRRSDGTRSAGLLHLHTVRNVDVL